MTTAEYSPLSRESVGRASSVQHYQAIAADYYDITDVEEWPVAGLLVLLDGARQPVRAELHLYDNLPAHLQEAATRQARLALQDHYLGGDPVPLRVLETIQIREEMEVRLPPLGARPLPIRLERWRVAAAVGVAALVLIALVWVGVAQRAGRAPRQPVEAATAGSVIEAVTVSDASNAEPTQVTPGVPDGGDLPPSRNARPELRIGVRVQMTPGLQLALRSQPGADAGEIIGAMGAGDMATIVGGPRMTAGDSDTIVWWYVELDDGTQAWAAANTSQQTLLVPVP
jgi:hypothetical protein